MLQAITLFFRGKEEGREGERERKGSIERVSVQGGETEER